MRPILILATGLMIATVAVPARAQGGGSLQSLLEGKSAPLTLKLKELSPSWRRIQINTPDTGAGAAAMAGGLMGAMFGGGGGMGGQKPGTYTQGETLTVAGETFLVTYKPEIKTLDISALMRLGQGGELPPPEKLSGESTLHLNLLNIRHIAGIGEIRPFDLNRELAESEKSAKEEAELRAQMMGRFGGAGVAAPAVGEAVAIPDAPEPVKPVPAKPASKPKAPTKAPAKKR